MTFTFGSWQDYAAWGGCSLLVWLVYALHAVRSASMKEDVDFGLPLALAVAFAPVMLVIVPTVLFIFGVGECLLWPTRFVARRNKERQETLEVLGAEKADTDVALVLKLSSLDAYRIVGALRSHDETDSANVLSDAIFSAETGE